MNDFKPLLGLFEILELIRQHGYPKVVLLPQDCLVNLAYRMPAEKFSEIYDDRYGFGGRLQVNGAHISLFCLPPIYRASLRNPILDLSGETPQLIELKEE